MKFNCGLTWQEKFRIKREWHRWFAWYPVRVGHKDCRWLEFLDRKGTWHEYADFWTYQYRTLK